MSTTPTVNPDLIRGPASSPFMSSEVETPHDDNHDRCSECGDAYSDIDCVTELCLNCFELMFGGDMGFEP